MAKQWVLVDVEAFFLIVRQLLASRAMALLKAVNAVGPDEVDVQSAEGQNEEQRSSG